MNNIRWIDSHCHLDFDPFINQIPEVLKSMTEHQVSHALCIGVNLEDFPRVLSVAEQSEHFWATVGVHPDYENVQEPTVQQLCDLSQHHKVIGIGETGLDYYRLKKAEVQWQRDRFKTHILAAKEVQKPLIVHTREAAADTISILKEVGQKNVNGVMHCFTESWEIAQEAMKLGFYISFSGVVTFKNAVKVQEVARNMPLNRILIETDSPYLAPTPHRGKTNQPAWCSLVGEFIAQLKGISVQEVADATTENFETLFQINRNVN